MKFKIFILIQALLMFLFPKQSIGQTPNLGTAINFTLFTATGAFNNGGVETYVIGDVGTNVGAFNGFPPGTIIGQIHVADVVSAQAASDVLDAYASFSGLSCGIQHVALLGGGELLSPNVYCIGEASSLTGTLILDGGGNYNSIFVIKIDGAFILSSNSEVILINGASLCNVYWQINGQFDIGINSIFRGTAVVVGAINLYSGASLFGRVLSTAGAISLESNSVTIGLPPTPSIIKLGGKSEFCPCGIFVLSGNFDGIWNTGATTPFITATVNGNYFVTNTNACGSIESNHILVTGN